MTATKFLPAQLPTITTCQQNLSCALFADALIVELVPKDYPLPRSLSKLENHNLAHSRELPYQKKLKGFRLIRGRSKSECRMRPYVGSEQRLPEEDADGAGRKTRPTGRATAQRDACTRL